MTPYFTVPTAYGQDLQADLDRMRALAQSVVAKLAGNYQPQVRSALSSAQQLEAQIDNLCQEVGCLSPPASGNLPTSTALGQTFCLPLHASFFAVDQLCGNVNTYNTFNEYMRISDVPNVTYKFPGLDIGKPQADVIREDYIPPVINLPIKKP